MKSNKQYKNTSKYTKAMKPSKDKQRRTNSNHNVSDTTNDVHVSGNVNDASYYFSNELLKNQLANISFNDFTGVPVRFTSGLDGRSSNVEIPTTMIMYLNPSAGFTDESSGLGSAINMAALKTYTELSANNAKTTNYAPQDITMLFLSLGSLIALSSHISRLFGLAYLYSQRNRTYPKGLLESLGVDYDDLMSNYANYKVRYNTIMNAASAIPVPQNVTYFSKCSEIFSGIYLDMDGSPMAQNYAFAPQSVWVLNEQDVETGSYLETYAVKGSSRSMNALLAILDSMVGALLQSATLNYIYADILRLADKGLPLLKFAMLPDNYVVLPAYNPEIRKWINNASVMGTPLGASVKDENHTASNNVYSDPDTNTIVYRPQFNISLYEGAVDRILNFDYGTFTADDIIYATRLMTAFTVTDVEGEKRTDLVALPDFYVTSVAIYYNNALKGEVTFSGYNSNITIESAALISAFDWAPIFPIGSDGRVTSILGDLNYYTTVDYDYLSSLQDATYLGLFEIR